MRSRVVALPGWGEPRVAVVAEVAVAGERWTVACTHLSTSGSVARRQLVAGFDVLAGRPPPRVPRGDLNTSATSVAPWSSANGYPPPKNGRASWRGRGGKVWEV